MAGRPQRKAREAEARKRAEGGRAKRATPAERRRVLARAEAVGDRTAAHEAGIPPDLLRKWRSRARQAPAPAPDDLHGLEGLRRAVADARGLERLAAERTRELLEAGEEGKAREAATSGGIYSDKCRAAERLPPEAEAEAAAEGARLDRDRLDLLGAVLRATFTAVELPLPVATLRELAAHAAAGEPLEVAQETARQDRARLLAAVRPELRAEWEAEKEADAEALAADSPDLADKSTDSAQRWQPTPGGWREDAESEPATPDDPPEGEPERRPRPRRRHWTTELHGPARRRW